jgi:hypothetical protein
MGDRPAACESCQAEIIFALISNQAGRKPSWMPLNPDPDPDGNVAAYCDETGRMRGRVLVKGQEPAPHEKRYLPHFASCTNPAAHRRRQRGKWTSAQAAHRSGQRRGRNQPARFDVLPGMTRLPARRTGR